MPARAAHQNRARGGLGVDRAPDGGQVAVHRFGRGVLAARILDDDLQHALRGRLEAEARELPAERFEHGHPPQPPAASGTACTLTIVSTW